MEGSGGTKGPRGERNGTVALHRRDRPGDDQLRGGVRRHEGPGAAGGRHPAVRGAAARRRRARRPRGRCSRRSSTCPAGTSCPPARRGCPGARRPTGSSASSPGSRGRRSPATWSPAPRAGSAIPGVDREADILPWGSPPEVAKVSPVEASADYLAAHPRRLERRSSPATTPPHRLEQQEVVLTVPASFDEAARELTARGRQAGRARRRSRCSRSRRRRSTAGSSRTRTAGSARSAPAS